VNMYISTSPITLPTKAGLSQFTAAGVDGIVERTHSSGCTYERVNTKLVIDSTWNSDGQL